jgi:PKD repeat protein
MAEAKGEGTLVWGVLLLIVVAGLAAFALSPQGTGPPPGGNLPPRPLISPANFSAEVGESVEFTAANSTDPDGTIKGFSWNFGDGGTGTGAIVSHQYDVTGAFVVRLEVTDDKGAKNSTSTHIWIDLNQELLGTATWNKFSPGVVSVVEFPVDPNATKVALTLQLNTSAPAGARAIVSVIDPNGAVVKSENVTIAFGGPTQLPTLVVPGENLTVPGQWQLKVEAQPANGAQFSATVGYTGTLRVEYKPA